MIWEYNYEKEMVSSVLSDMIMLNDILRPKYLGQRELGGVVTILFNAALTPDEHDTLNVIVDLYNADHRLVKRHVIKSSYAKDAGIWAEDFMMEFISNNLERAKTTEQIALLMQNYGSLILACITGSIGMIYGIVSTMVPDEISGTINQEEIDEFKKRLEIRLGLI
jgi:hypothetical protein